MLPVSGFHRLTAGLVLAFAVSFLAGCGQSQPPAAAEADAGAGATLAEPAPIAQNPLAEQLFGDSTEPAMAEDEENSNDADDARAAAELVVSEPEKGSPEWLIRQILAVKIQPLPPIAESGEGEEAQAKLKAEIDQQKQIRRERNEEIIKLAEEAIARTHGDEKRQQIYKAAVHHLVDTRLQLAKLGNAADVKALETLADDFYKNAPESEAASQAAFALVTLAHHFALQNGLDEPAWLVAFSRHAQVYATRFPNDQARAVPYLISAAKSCDMNGLTEEARSCYGLIKSRFPQAPEVEQLAGVFRRLDAIGQPAQIAGPTPEGSFFTVEDHKDKAVLVVFWASHVPQFAEDLPKIQAIAETYKKYLVVVGVSLDETEGALDKFVEEHGLTWPQIFHTERDKRGWNSPVAVFYGINRLPAMWLVDPYGKVVETALTADNAEQRLRDVMLPYLKGIKDGSIQPASAKSTDGPQRN